MTPRAATVMQAGVRVPVYAASSEALIAAAVAMDDLAAIDAIRAEIQRRGLTGGGFCAMRCSVSGCGGKALYRVGKDGYCRAHEPAARRRLYLGKEAVR